MSPELRSVEIWLYSLSFKWGHNQFERQQIMFSLTTDHVWLDNRSCLAWQQIMFSSHNDLCHHVWWVRKLCGCQHYLHFKNIFERFFSSKRQILNSSKLREFANDDSKFDENGRHFSKTVKNTVGKGGIACHEQFLLFPPCFQKTCTADM